MSNIETRKQEYQKYVNDLIWEKVERERENAFMYGKGLREMVREDSITYNYDLASAMSDYRKHINMTQTKGNKKPIEKKLYTYYI